MSDKVAKRGVSIYIDGKEVVNSVKSIAGEMKKLQNEQAKMTMGADDYIAHGKKIAYLDSLLQEHKQTQKEIAKEYANMQKASDSFSKNAESGISKTANMMNKYFAMFTTALTFITGLTLGLKKFMDERNKLEDSKLDLQALTGLDDKSVNKLEGWAKQMASSPLEGTTIRIKASASEIMEAYKLVGSAKPELLKNAEALNEVTKQSMILAQAAGMPLADAVHGTVIALNQYSAGAEEAAKYVNILAAGSQAGAQEVPYIAEALVKFGAVAKLANVPFAQSVALIEAIGEKGFQAEVAGTGIKTFFTKLLQGADETNPAVVGMSTALDNLNAKFSNKGGFAEMTKLFGQDNVVIAQTLIDQRAKFNDLTTAVTGTNTAIDQATITSKAMNTKMAQAQNQFMILGMELVQNLNPAVLKATNLGNAFLKFIVTLPKWLNENKGLIISLAGALGTYAMWLGVITLAERKNTIEKSISLGLTKARIIADLAWCAVQQTMAGNFKTAGKAMKALNVEMGLNPYVALGVAIAAVTVALYKLATAQSTAQKAYREYNVQSAIETTNANQLFEAAKKNLGNKEEHKKLIDKINSVYGEYIGYQLTEKSNLDEISRAQLNVNSALRDKIAIQTKEQFKGDVTKKYVTQQVDLADKLRSDMATFKGDDVAGVFKEEIDKILQENAGNLEKGYKLASEKLKNQMGNDLRPGQLITLREYAVSVSKMNNELSDIDKKFQGFEAKIDLVIYDPTKKSIQPKEGDVSPDGTMIYKSGKWVAKTNNFGPGGDDKAAAQKKKVDEAMKALEIQNLKDIAAIKKRYIDGDIAFEYDYNETLLDQQDKYDSQRKKKLQELLKTVSDPGVKLEMNNQIAEIDKKALDRQIEQNNKIKKILLDADPIKAENQAYDNRLRELGLFGVKKENMTADQLETLRVLEEQHNATLSKLSTKQALIDLKQLDKDQQDAEKLAAEDRASGILNEQQYKDKLLAIEIEFLKKKLIIQGLSADEADKIAKQLTGKLLTEADKSAQELLSFKDKYGLDELDRFKSQKELELKLLQEYIDKGLISEKEAVKVRAVLASEEFRAKTKNFYDSAEAMSRITGDFSNAFQGFQQAEEKSIETKYQKQIDAAAKAGKDTTKIEEQKNKELAALRAKNADAMFAVQVAGIIASTAAAAIDSYANAVKIPYAGLVLAPIAAAAAVAYGASQIVVANSARESAKEGYYDGGWHRPEGFTGGDNPREIRGRFPDGQPYHGDEFIANHHTTRNPNVVPVLDLFDEAQKNGTASSLSKADISRALRLSPSGYYDGGFRPSGSNNAQSVDKTPTAEYMMAVVAAVNRLNDHLDNGIETNLSISGEKGVANQLKKYNSLISNSKRG